MEDQYSSLQLLQASEELVNLLCTTVDCLTTSEQDQVVQGAVLPVSAEQSVEAAPTMLPMYLVLQREQCLGLAGPAPLVDYVALLVICDPTFFIQNQDVWTAGRPTKDRKYYRP